jgi:hypothetical protein
MAFIQGQPQCLRNVITTGFPSFLGNVIWSEGGAREPVVGIGYVSTLDGDSQELNSWVNDMFLQP